MPATGESLPPRFPVFPLRGCLLLPGGHLPLNIFEPRYLAMVRDAMRTDRVIGMIQPMGEEEAAPALFRTGCAGRIGSFAETADGRYLITLVGLCRFDVARELAVATPYRQIEADYGRWRGDLEPRAPPEEVRDALFRVLRQYLARHGISCEWPTLERAPLRALITSLAMICPFAAEEKQALLEAADLECQGRLLVALMGMEAMPCGAESSLKH